MGPALAALVLAALCQTALADGERGVAKLDDIEVRATGPSGAYGGNWRNVNKSAVVDMKDVLKYQPDLAVASGNGQAQQLYLRNVGENQLTFTVDGAGQKSQNFHHQSRFMFNPTFLKRIMIEKGSGAASSGLGVTSGAIRMETVDATDLLEEGRNWGFKINGGWRSNLGYEGGAGVYGTAGPFEAVVILNRVHQGNYKDGNGRVIDYSATDQTGALAKVTWNLNEDHRLTFSQRYEGDHGDRPLRLNLMKLRGVPPMDTTIEQNTSNLQYRGKNVGFFDKIDANAYWSQRRDRKTAKGQMNPKMPLPPKTDTAVNTLGANLGFATNFGDGHVFRYGVNALVENVKTKKWMAGRGREDKRDVGAYAEMVLDWHPVTLTGGVRYDWFWLSNTLEQTRTGWNVNPSLAALWEVSPEFSLRASIAQASRSPRLYESYILSLPWGGNIGLQEGIEAERSITGEIGFDWNRGGLSLSGSLFNQNIHDYLLYRSQKIGDVKYEIEQNVGKMTNKGYELEAYYSKSGFTVGMGVFHSVPLLNGEYYAWAQDIMPTGRMWNASLSYRFSNPSIEIGWRGRLSEEYRYREIGADKDTVLEGYPVHDLYLNWRPLGKDTWNVNFMVNNVTNQFYHSQNNFRSARTTVEDLSPEPGRDFRISMNYRF